MRVVVLGGDIKSLINFRGELLKTLVAAGHAVTAMAPGPSEAEVATLESFGVQFRSFSLARNGLNPVHDVRSFLGLRTAFRELRPDVVLAYMIKPVIWGGLALRGLRGIRFYALITGVGFAFNGEGFLRRALTGLVTRLYRLSLARTAGVVFQNGDDRALFESQRIVDPRKSHVINGSGVDVLHFPPVPIPSGRVVFLTIARLLGEKGLRELAAACRVVRKSYPDVVFCLAGAEDPSPDGIPLAEVMAWQREGIVDYAGVRADVRPLLAACSVFVLPSYREGLPRSVLEAMATGRPILTTDVPGCRETVVANENGFLVPVRDAEALAERMIWFIENPSSWNRMGLRSRAMCEERFDVRQVNSHLMDIMKLTRGLPTRMEREAT